MKKARLILGILCVISAVGCGYYVQKSRENIDTEGPKLEAASDTLEVSINATEDELTKDVVAEDKKDGNVSDSIIIENITKKVGGDENQFEITYVGFDKSSNSGRLKRNLVYTDYTKTTRQFHCWITLRQKIVLMVMYARLLLLMERKIFSRNRLPVFMIARFLLPTVSEILCSCRFR